MDRYDITEFLTYAFVLTLPFTYFLATVYIPYNYNSNLYTQDSSEVKEYVSKHQPVAIREIEENTSLTYFQSLWVLQGLSIKGELAKYPDGVRVSSSKSLGQ